MNIPRLAAIRSLLVLGLMAAPAAAQEPLAPAPFPRAAAVQSDEDAAMPSVDRVQVTVGTGSITGVYYPAGGAICAAVNVDRPVHHIRCKVKPSQGSVANIEDLRRGRTQFAIVQSDIQYAAVNGTGPFREQGPFRKLRSVVSLYSESLTVLANASSHINGFEDLRGKRVNIGSIGSGARATLDGLMSQYGWSYGDFAESTDLPPAALAQALCSQRIDAMVVLAGHPNSAVQDVTNNCPAVIVPIDGPKREALLRENRYYAAASVPGGLYRYTTRDVPTFGVLATLVTTTDVTDDVVHTVVRGLFEHLSHVQSMHAALSHLDRNSMAYAGLTAPLADGAVRYYRESGLLPTN